MNVELMKQAIAVAVIQLFEGYPGDVLKKFTLEELEGFCEITEPLRPKQVEDIYRNAWDYIRAALSAPEAEPVAWLNHYAGMTPRIDSAATAGALRSEPLYLHPSAPERKPMTDEKAYALAGAVFPYSQHAKCLELIRDVEAFHGITKG